MRKFYAFTSLLFLIFFFCKSATAQTVVFDSPTPETQVIVHDLKDEAPLPVAEGNEYKLKKIRRYIIEYKQEGYQTVNVPFCVFINEKKLSFPTSLAPLPTAPDTNINLVIDDIITSAKEEDFNFKSYSSYEKYLDNSYYSDGYRMPNMLNDESSRDEEEKEEESAIDIMNARLKEYGYKQKEISAFNYDQFYINGDIQKITFIRAGYFSKIELTCSWELKNSYGDSLYNFINEQSSNWQPSASFYPDFQAHITSVLENHLIDFINQAEFKGAIKSHQDAVNATADFSPIVFSDKIYANNIPSAVKAVGTVVTEQGNGSAVLISSDGYMVTNYHVLSQADTINVVFDAEEEYPAVIVRSNAQHDLALLKLAVLPEDLAPLKIQFDDAEAEIGTTIFAIGSPGGLELGQTLSKGIISALRTFNEQQYIQTDVSINAGNSGGALITQQGELIGIVNAKYYGFGIEGIGFAIPVAIFEKALGVYFED